MGATIMTRSVIQVRDFETDADLPAPLFLEPLRSIARAIGYRSQISVPMLCEGNIIGAITVVRTESGPFPTRQIELLKTFADQAVIAIENVRLFTELQASNRELTTALDTQTATSDILRVISRSQTDVQPVFDAIVASAVRLLGGYSGTLTRLAGDQVELAANTSTDAAGDAALRAFFPQPLHRGARTSRRFAIGCRSISPTPRRIPACPESRTPSPVSAGIEAWWSCRCSVTTRRSGRSG